MEDMITHLGIGGIFCILVLREVFNFMSKGKEPKDSNGNSNGKDFIKRSEFDEHRKFVQYRDNCTEIVKRIESVFVQRTQIVDENFKRMDSQFNEVKQLIRNGGSNNK